MCLNPVGIEVLLHMYSWPWKMAICILSAGEVKWHSTLERVQFDLLQGHQMETDLFDQNKKDLCIRGLQFLFYQKFK